MPTILVIEVFIGVVVLAIAMSVFTKYNRQEIIRENERICQALSMDWHFVDMVLVDSKYIVACADGKGHLKRIE